MAIILPVGKSFDTEWLVSVAGGLWTVSTAGIITAGEPFKECATCVVLADRNLEKPGDIHLEENILEKKNHATIFVNADFENFSNMAGQPRSQGLLAFQYGGGRREDPGTQQKSCD